MSIVRKKSTIVLGVILLLILFGSYEYVIYQQQISNQGQAKQSEFQKTLNYFTVKTSFLVGVPFRRTENAIITKETYETLLAYTGTLVDPKPLLAERWEVSPDGKVYTFYLRQGIKFYPSGDPFTADTVKFTFDNSFDLKMIGIRPSDLFGAPDAFQYNRTETVDQYTVKVYLNKPLSWFLHAVAYPSLGGIVNPKFVNAHGGIPKSMTQFDPYLQWHQDVTGPYIISDFKQGDRAILNRNPTYWKGWNGEMANRPQQLVIRVIPEASTRMMLLGRGDMDIGFLDISYLPELRKRISTDKLPLIINDDPDGKIIWIILNMNKPPTNDIHIRRMLAYSFNSDEFIKSVLYGFGDRMTSYVPKGMPGYQDNLPSYAFDLDKAKQELTLATPENQAMVKQGIKHTYSAGYGIGREGSQIWKSDLAKIGVNLILDEVSNQAYVDMKHSGAGTIVSDTWLADFPDMATYYTAFTSGYYGVKAGYRTPQAWIDDAYAKAAAEANVTQRLKYYKQIEEWGYDQVPYVKVASSRGGSDYNVRGTWVRGYKSYIMDASKATLSGIWKDLPPSQNIASTISTIFLATYTRRD